MQTRSDFYGPNEGYVLELYERYSRDPNSVDSTLRAFFQHWTPPDEYPVNGTSPTASADPSSAAPVTGTAAPITSQPALAQTALAQTDKLVGAVNYAQAIRSFGHLGARLDPLGSDPVGDPSLLPETHGITEADLANMPATLVGGPIATSAANALEAIRALRTIYSSSIGFDYDHVREPQERAWLREAAEAERFRLVQDPVKDSALLDRLTQVETFERFLQRIFPGKFRFSIEGLDITVPVLDEVIGEAASDEIYTILIGMAHRGRLNVLAHILNKPYSQILAEFKDPVQPNNIGADLGWTGDVKYHAGAEREVNKDVRVSMSPNPSHLEAVNPVVEGMARAAGTSVDMPGKPHFDPTDTLPILIHGDAAFPGQGIVAETLNMSSLPGYWTGGTIHIIANNQLGFTTDPIDSRSTLYASDLAKGFKIPVVHVNADDAEACIEVGRLAYAYRAKFQKDFLIDLIGYRRYGHNEVDEPGFTQPTLYQIVQSHETVRALWAKTLIARNEITQADADAMVARYMADLQKVYEALDPEEDLVIPAPEPPTPGAARRIKTAVSADRLNALNHALLEAPDGFEFHPKLLRARQRRADMFNAADKVMLDWSTAEELAFASLLEEGVSIRLTGQDVQRGTFSQRHAIYHDVHTDATYTPLQTIPQAKAAFEIHDSPLSENAALGFEYGYNVQEPGRFVLWEAQYGDFNNGAQVIIDEFISSARAKWGQTPSLVMLLPHGLEGSGPDHASGRLERFLQLSAETNMRIANCTTAAQYFHLLRRQALLLEGDPLPLIIMTPKSLLRNPLVASPLSDFVDGVWHPVIDDVRAHEHASDIRHLILCSGKIYIDLISSAYRDQNASTAIVRVEQLYPLPDEELATVIAGYPNVEEVAWVQEEPQNMGAWEFMREPLSELLGDKPLHYVGRAPSSSPAEGSSAWHAVKQEEIIKHAFEQYVKPVKTLSGKTPVLMESR